MLIERTTGQAQRKTTFIPLGEALMHAERCRHEAQLMQAEAICRHAIEAQPNPDASGVLAEFAGTNAYSTSSTCFGPVPNARCASAASVNLSISPSSTAPVFDVDTPVRRSFTI